VLDDAGVEGIVATPEPPSEVRRLDEAHATPLLLQLFLLALGLSTLSFGLSLSARARRRDLAVLRALGSTSTQLRGSVLWEGLTIVGVAQLVGLPLGVVIGRTTWRVLVDNLAIDPTASWAAGSLALVVVGAVVAALTCSLAPARRAARLQPGAVLHQE
jgi:ABC-type lipoprotein release transport system permease subunit